MGKKLTPKQALFVAEYLIDLNATQAAIRAGYSKKTAQVIGSENLLKPMVSAAIQESRQVVLKRLDITKDRILKELARIGFSDLRNVLTSGGNLIDPQDWDDDTAAAISSIEVVSNTQVGKDEDEDAPAIVERTHKIKVWDKLSALEKLGKYRGMWDEKPQDFKPVVHVHLDKIDLAAAGRKKGDDDAGTS
jgi:phage terminase small subunit